MMIEMPLVTLRTVQPTDMDACLRLLYAMQQETHWAQYAPPSAEEFVWFLAGLPYLSVAVAGEEIIGICGGSIQRHACFPSVPYVLEEALYVIPSWRRGSVGSDLVNGLRTWGWAQGAQALVIGRPDQNGETIRWYRRRGPHV